jgi:hypothetical protein
MILVSLILSLGFIGYGETIDTNSVLTGEDIQAILANNLSLKNLIIEFRRDYPMRIYKDYMVPLNDLSSSFEEVFIFGDGEVFSHRAYSHKAMENLRIAGYEFDASWEFYGSGNGGRVRSVKYCLNSDQIRELLSILGTHEGEFLPGEGIMDHRFIEQIRILYNGKEGRLFEVVSALIGSKENLAFMDYFLDTVRAIEWQVEIAKPVMFLPDLNRKLEQFGWEWESKLEVETFADHDAAWKAHGIEGPKGPVEKVDYWEYIESKK